VTDTGVPMRARVARAEQGAHTPYGVSDVETSSARATRGNRFITERF